MGTPGNTDRPLGWPWPTVAAWQDVFRTLAGWVPIRALTPDHRERIERHLLALAPRDRYLRFGQPSTDEQIGRYVQALDFARDDLFGIFNRRLQLIAVAHLAQMPHAASAPPMAEFGVSVLPETRGRGYGARLFDRAVLHARNQGCERLMIHALSENTVMLRIASQAGATVQRDGPDSEAWLQLPAENVATHMNEMVEEQAAELDYRWKLRALNVHRAWNAWRNVQNSAHRRKSALEPTASSGVTTGPSTQTGDSPGLTDR